MAWFFSSSLGDPLEAWAFFFLTLQRVLATISGFYSDGQSDGGLILRDLLGIPKESKIPSHKLDELRLNETILNSSQSISIVHGWRVVEIVVRHRARSIARLSIGSIKLIRFISSFRGSRTCRPRVAKSQRGTHESEWQPAASGSVDERCSQ